VTLLPTLRRAVVATALVLAAGAHAQDDKSPIRLLVGLAPGGTVDVGARLIAEKLRESLGRPVVVENKLGAGQRIAMNDLKRAPPDGRTLLVVTNSPFVINPHIYNKLDYDPVKDFTPIASVFDFDLGFAAGPKIAQVRDMKQFAEWGRANAPVPYATAGAGTLPHFVGIAIGQSTKVDVTHVPYKGGIPAIQDLAGGQVPLLVNSLGDLVEMHKAGKIRVLAVSGEKRSPLLPDVPTLKESGVDVSSVVKVGVYGPPGMAPDLVKRLNAAIVQAVNAPDVRERLMAGGATPSPSTPEQLAAAQADELNRLEPYAKASGYKAD
jgi:tripartite-type tricarboxylate transporter receptor subunit TctC